MKLRLLLTEECNRNCLGCCNKDWDLTKLPSCFDYTPYSEIMLTGGEPMLNPTLIKSLAQLIKLKNWVPVYLYTAKVDDIQQTLSVLFFIDGITLTLHDQADVKPFLFLNSMLPHQMNKSLRLNVFKGIKLPNHDFKKWKLKQDIEWAKNCPLPEDEVFMRFN